MKKLLTIFSILLSFGGFGQSLTEVLYPLYIQGVGSGNVTDDRKVPFACRMTASGLTPNAAYRYYNRFVTDPAVPDNGQGNYIIANQAGDFIRVTAASLATPGRYGEFTTDERGTYTGWFIVEPSIATTHYQPGTQIYFRLLLNNGAGGGAVATRLTATNPVTVLGFGALPTQGTGIYNSPNDALNAKNFVMLYDNIGGTGRPVAGTFIESDGTVNDATTSYYAPFYANNVDANDKVWGTIIPNNLANGINNISQYALSTGVLVNACTSANGVYGAANTANANGGLTPLVTTCEPSGQCNISLSTEATNVSCFGESTGAVNVTVTGATAPVTYSWSNGTTTEDLTGIPAGTYTVTVTDASNCTATATVTISQPISALAASSTSTPVTTSGGSDGTATATVEGGTPPYTYLWNPGGQTTATATGLTAGAYTVTITDANGCITTAMITVGSPSCNVILSFAQTNVLCFGESNGTATVTTEGGSGEVSYLWSNGQTTATATGLAAGSYTVAVTDASGCTASGSVTITEPPVLAASASSTPVTTTGGSDGTATTTVNGGTPPFTYLWNPGGQTTETATGLTAGAYTVTITDANGCITTAIITVGSPSCNVILSFAQTNVLCFGESNGTATVTTEGSSGEVSYLWSNGQTTATATGLAAGSYTVAVTDASGCTASGSVTITEPPVLVASASSTPVTTTGGSDGTATTTVNGGTPPFTYLWNPGGQTTETATGLTAGVYTVIITDVNGCTITATTTVGSPSCDVITSITATGVSCVGTTNNGALELTVSGGALPYAYLWSNGETTEDISGLAPGAYVVTVTDANGCAVVAGATVSARLAVTSIATPPACGETTTTVTVSATGGTLPYSGTGTFTVNTGTQYSFSVTDASGCLRTVVGNIANPLVASSSAGTILCGATTTMVTVTASAGTPPYTGTGTFTVGAGSYSFEVTDARGCVTVATGVVNEPACEIITEVYYPKFIQGVGSGNPADDRKVPYAARLKVSGLKADATYRYFNRFVNDVSAGGNGQGNYVIVNQSGNFTRVTSASLASPGRYGEFTTDASGSFEGWFVAEPTIATDHYQPGTQLYFRLMLNDGAGGGSVASRVTLGVPVTVLGFGSTPTDGTGIRATPTDALTPKNFMMLYDNLDGTGRPVSGTFIESDGTDNNATTSGYAPFYATQVDGVDKTWGSLIPNNLPAGINNISQYALSDGSFINKCISDDGRYDTTVTANASGGLSELVITCTPVGVVDPCTLTVSISTANVSCNGANNGKADLTVKGGAAPFVYSWSNGAATEDLTGIPAGSYLVIVKDAKGCVTKDSVKISEPAILSAYPRLENPVSCYKGSNAAVVIYAEGGTPPYKYAIGDQTNSTGIFKGLPAGHYTGIVTDANGCTIQGSGDIEEPKPVVANVKATSNNLIGYGSTYVLFLLSDYQKVKLTASAYGGAGYFIYNWGEAGKTAAVYVSPKKTTVYQVVATDKNGCSKTCTIMIYVIDLRGSRLSESPLISEVSPNGIISENNLTVFKLYPNPASSYLTIESPITTMLEQSELSVFDMKGRLMVNRKMNKGNLNRIDVSALQQGMYLVQLKSSGRVIISGKINIAR